MAAAQLSPGPAPLRARAPPGRAPAAPLLPRTAAGRTPSPAPCGASSRSPDSHRPQSVPRKFIILSFPPRDNPLGTIISIIFFFSFPIIISYLFLISRFKSPKLERVILGISLFPRPRAGPELPSSALPTAQTFPAGSCGGSGGPGSALGGLGRVPAARQGPYFNFTVGRRLHYQRAGYTGRNLCPV